MIHYATVLVLYLLLSGSWITLYRETKGLRQWT